MANFVLSDIFEPDNESRFSGFSPSDIPSDFSDIGFSSGDYSSYKSDDDQTGHVEGLTDRFQPIMVR